ncbi:MAG: DUF4150 domain-containing protein [Bacteroidota bacterium]
MGIACATIPNICKMPGPPAPFVPTPLPNIAKSNDSPKGYSKKVKIEGQTVAIRGATFKSMGDIASKGTGGGLISANTHGPAKFIMPGSFTVKIEGKGVHLLGEPMLNNCGPTGNPPNTGATMMGVMQVPSTPVVAGSKSLECGEIGTYGEQKKRTGGGKYHRDHIPSKAALKERAKELNGGEELTTAQKKAIDNGAVSVVIPASAHRQTSPTYGGRNKGLMGSDKNNLQEAAKRDTAAMRDDIANHCTDQGCIDAYNEAADFIDAIDNKTYDDFLTGILNDDSL